MAASNPIVQSIVAGARARNIDPNAVLAVSRMEGLSGGIGDGGHAFGPFQLNNAGGVITGRFQGESPQQIQQWATSPAGIDFALGRIGQVAGGLSGQAAVRAIVSRFERPADIPGETSRAIAAYGTPSAAPVAPMAPPPAAGGMPAPTPGRPFNLQAALAQISQGDYGGFYGSLGKHLAAPTQAAPPQPAAPLQPPQQPTAPAPAHGGMTIPIHGNIGRENPAFLSELTTAAHALGAVAIVATLGERSPQYNRAVGGATHSNHLPDQHGYGHAIDGYAVMADGSRVPLGTFLAKTAGKYGLRSGASFNWNGRPDVVHVDDFRNQGR